jgi:hypothetical protein
MLCSLFVASYDSQGLRWRYSNPPLWTDVRIFLYLLYLFISSDPFSILILTIIVNPLMFKYQACYIISKKLKFLLHDALICDCIVRSICSALVVLCLGYSGTLHWFACIGKEADSVQNETVSQGKAAQVWKCSGWRCM